MSDPDTEFQKSLMNPGQWSVRTGETGPEMHALRPIHRTRSHSSNRAAEA